jgi:hypothetical protein
MNQLIVPDIFKDSVIALFTRKHPGADLNAISIMLKIKKEDIYMPVQEHTDTIHILHADRTPVTADAVITRGACIAEEDHSSHDARIYVQAGKHSNGYGPKHKVVLL